MSLRALSRLPWVKKPLLANAPMATMAGPALAVAVTRAGGLGFVGPSAKTEDANWDLDEVSQSLKGGDSTGLSEMQKNILPVGIGFLVWKDDLETVVGVVGRYRPAVVWLYAPVNGQEDLDVWTEKIRDASSGETQVWLQIGTVNEAQDILRSSQRPDVVVVQGSEAGGHGRAHDGMGLVALLPEVADVLKDTGIPLLAAGGLADGRGASAAICLGAEGVVMGTRFLVSNEARISNGYRDAVVQARNGAVSTTRTLLYNHLRGTYGWPEPFSPRGVINRSWEEHLAGVPFDELKKRHDEAQKRGDAAWGREKGRAATYAGAGVGLVGDMDGAGSIVERVRQELRGRLDNARGVC